MSSSCSPLGPKIYSLPCKFCDLMFDSGKDLVQHKIKKRKGEKAHPYRVFDKAFKSLPMLSQYKSQQHRADVY